MIDSDILMMHGYELVHAAKEVTLIHFRHFCLHSLATIQIKQGFCADFGDTQTTACSLECHKRHFHYNDCATKDTLALLVVPGSRP